MLPVVGCTLPDMQLIPNFLSAMSHTLPERHTEQVFPVQGEAATGYHQAYNLHVQTDPSVLKKDPGKVTSKPLERA